MITLSCKLELSSEDKEKLLDLMRRFSSAVRYAYNRLLEDKSQSEIQKLLQETFSLNARYSASACFKAQAILNSCKERGQNPKKLVFGGRKLFEKLSKNHLKGKVRAKLKKEWKERRQGTLYSVGQANNKGNQNTRFVKIGDEWFLRINTGNREWIYAKVLRSVKRERDKWIDFIWRLTEAELSGAWFPYTVEIKLREGELYAFVSFEEVLPEVTITKDFGVIGIDLNASPLHIAWAEVSKDGNLVSYGQISMHELLEKETAKQRKDYLYKLAHEITNLAKEKGKAIAIERLRKVSKGQRGDGKGKLRKRLHNWIYAGLLDKLKKVARRKGIQVIEVNPAFTSVIGALKYCPNYLIDKDTAGAYVIGRRALGFKEDIPENYLRLLNDKDYMLYSIAKLEERKQELKARLKEETNTYKRKAIKQELSKLNKDIELLYKHLQSLESEPSAQEPVNRRKEQVRGVLYGTQKAWRVLKVALVFPTLGKSFVRDFSPLRSIMVSGDWSRRTSKARPLSEWEVAQSGVK